VHTNLHIKGDVQPEQLPKTLMPLTLQAAPQPPPPTQNGEGSPLAAAMENLRAIANDCRTTPVHITMERLSRLLYSYMQDVDYNSCRDTAPAPALSKPPPAINNNRQRQRPILSTIKDDVPHTDMTKIKNEDQIISPFVNTIN
jgi:hypothetical protein